MDMEKYLKDREVLLKKLSVAANEILGLLESLTVTNSIGQEHTVFSKWFARLIINLVNQETPNAWRFVSNEKMARAANSMTSAIQCLRSIEDDETRITDELVADAKAKIDILENREMPWVQMLISSILLDKKQELNEMEQKWEGIIKDARAEALAAGAREFTEDFKEEAETQKKRARLWTFFAFTFGGGLLIFALSLIIGWPIEKFSKAPDISTPWSVISYFGNRLFAFSILFYATTWAGSMARICFNLASINKHRELSLRNLRAFSAASENSDVKDAIVVEAAQTVFGHIPAGFLGKAEPAISQPILSRVVDIIRKSKED